MDRPAFSYRFGTAEFDEARFELRVAGLPVDVERRALEVLAYLLRHAGEVATKDELLQEVWAGRVTVDKVLANAINKLRRALGEANASFISTQARVGYRFDGAVTRTAVGRQPGSQLALGAGQAVPGRVNFTLVRQLGHTGGSEVWLAEHPKTHEQRVYKFALDTDRLRSLKREVTLLRVLQECLTDTRHVIEILDWNLENAPFFIECRYGGASLAEWAATHLAAMPVPARLALFLQIVDAVAAAHAVGVLHKDLKPANVLVEGDAQAPHVRLTDFGSGHLFEPDRLSQLGITRMGMTVEDEASPGSTSGTPLYLAPELFAGQAPTVKSDVFALGILLYQLLADCVGQPMASGWETRIDDELLRDDLQQATHGDPERRLASAAALAERLRGLDQRRAEAVQRRTDEAAMQRDREALARTRSRRPWVVALVTALAVGVVAALALHQQALRARNDASLELARATALARFLNEDLIGWSNPLVSAKGPDATLREVLLAARDRVPIRFAKQQHTEASIRTSLASLFSAIDQFEDAETEARRALALLERDGDPTLAVTFKARALLVRMLARRGNFDEAKVHLADMERIGAKVPVVLARTQVAASRSVLLVTMGEHAKASVELRAAINGVLAEEPDNTAFLDALRMDLIATLSLAGQPEQAREEGRKLIAEARVRNDPGDLVIALTQLALVRAQGEDHAAAEQLLQEAQPVIVSRLGPDHSKHLTLLNERFAITFRRGDWPRAIEAAQQVHERISAKLGNEHVLTHVTLGNWARALVEAGQAEAALDKARRAHTEIARLVGAKAPQAQDAAFLLALAELDTGHVEQAQPLIDQLDVTVLESWRATGIWQAGIDGLRGIALQQRGQAEAARPLLDSALHRLAGEEELAQPGRAYVAMKQARSRLR